MSREIKFRVWDAWRGKMWQEQEAANMFLWIDEKGCLNSSAHGRVNPVMQYTGLKDFDGKESFEGDIIKSSNGHIGVIRFCENDAWFEIYWFSGNLIKYTSALCAIKSCQIIGNIHENPELLKQ